LTSVKFRSREVLRMANKSMRETFRKGVLTNNPLLFQIIGVCPVVAIASSVKNALVVALITALELIVIESLACLMFKKIKRSVRVLIYALLGFAINMPLFLLIGKVYPQISESIGIFLPLLAVSSIIAVKCETFAVKNNFGATLVDSFAASIGYGLVALIIGTVREILGSGSFFGKSVGLPYTADAFLMPFGGFLVMGFVAAAVKGLTAKKYSAEVNSSMLDTSQIRMLHIKHLKQLFDENDDDDIFFGDAPAFSPEPEKKAPKKKTVRRKKAPEQTIQLPALPIEAKEQTAESEQTNPEENKTDSVGYQPFAELLATLDNPVTADDKIDVEQPEPDPLELNEEWELLPDENAPGNEETADGGAEE